MPNCLSFTQTARQDFNLPWHILKNRLKLIGKIYRDIEKHLQKLV